MLRKAPVILRKLKRKVFFDLEVKNLNREELKSKDLDYGVKINRSFNRMLSLYGIGEDSVILEVNGQPIQDISTLDNFNTNDIDSILFLNSNGERVIFRN